MIVYISSVVVTIYQVKHQCRKNLDVLLFQLQFAIANVLQIKCEHSYKLVPTKLRRARC